MSTTLTDVITDLCALAQSIDENYRIATVVPNGFTTAALDIMLDGEGLHPSSKGARVKFSGSTRTVIDGPFAETKELIAGYWIWRVKSKAEAIEWVKRCPNPMPGVESEIEIRQIFDAEDFGQEFTPELREQEAEIRRQAEQLKKKSR